MAQSFVLDLQAHPKLRLWNEWLDFNVREHGQVSLECYEKSWYGKFDLYATAQIILEHWTEPTQDQEGFAGELSRGFAGIWDETQANGLTSDCKRIYGSRRERWQRICRDLRVQFPHRFRAWRAVAESDDGEPMKYIPEIIAAWRSEVTYVSVPQSQLASWSLSQLTAETQLKAGSNGVLYRSDIPFEMTLFDKIADNGALVRHGRECEVIAGFYEPRAIFADKRDVKVRLMGRIYGAGEAEILFEEFARHCDRIPV